MDYSEKITVDAELHPVTGIVAVKAQIQETYIQRYEKLPLIKKGLRLGLQFFMTINQFFNEKLPLIKKGLRLDKPSAAAAATSG